MYVNTMIFLKKKFEKFEKSNQGIFAAIYIQRLIKKPVKNFTCFSPAKTALFIGRLHENS